MLNLIRDYLKYNLDYMAFMQGLTPTLGPRHVQVDLTDRCNSNCIACWCNSPLVTEEDKSSIERQRAEMEKQTVFRLLESLSGLGTSELDFSGGGEPFMHQDAMEIFEYAKRLGFRVCINTNFTIPDRTNLEKLVRLNLDRLIISLWAATPETYQATHPNKKSETFDNLVEKLKTLRELKRLHRKKSPYVVLYNVIFNLNYHEIHSMYELAERVGADAVEFALMDAIPDKTDVLLLNDDQLKQAADQFATIVPPDISPVLRPLRKLFGTLSLDSLWPGSEPHIREASLFLQRLQEDSSSYGTYDKKLIHDTPCLAGWAFSRIMADGAVAPCLKAHRAPVGNVYNEDFSEIWKGEAQNQFRLKSASGKYNDPLFGQIGNNALGELGCEKICDDMGRNRDLMRKIKEMDPIQRIILNTFSKKLACSKSWREWLTQTS